MNCYKCTFIFIVLISSLLATCTKTEPDSSVSAAPPIVIRGVPFIKQKYHYCGPAALTSVMNFYGRALNQDEVARHIYTPELKGSLISDMKYYAEENGFRAKTENGDIASVRNLIDSNKPVVLLVDKGRLGINIQHYYVAYGYDPRKEMFIIHDGTKSGNEISYEKLDKEWEKMNRLMLIIENE